MNVQDTVFRQRRRHRTFDARWKALQGDVDMALQVEDFAWVEDCLAEMRVLYREEFGRELLSPRNPDPDLS